MLSVTAPFFFLSLYQKNTLSLYRLMQNILKYWVFLHKLTIKIRKIMHFYLFTIENILEDYKYLFALSYK